MEAFATRGFLAGLSASSPSFLASALARFGAALPFPLTGLGSTSMASVLEISSLTFDFRGAFLSGLVFSSDNSERSLPGDSALIVDREAAARFGLAGDDIMRYLWAGGSDILRNCRPLIKGLSGVNVVYDDPRGCEIDTTSPSHEYLEM